MSFQVKAINNITNQQVADQLVAAVEGGIGYWAQIWNYSSCPVERKLTDLATSLEIDYAFCKVYECVPLTDTGFILFIDAETAQDDVKKAEIWCLDRDAIQRGLQVMANIDPDRLKEIIDGTGDAETADCFLQYSLFGELVYG